MARHAPFVYEAWRDPKTLEILSEVAGVDLVPVMDYEIGHVNLTEKTDDQQVHLPLTQLIHEADRRWKRTWLVVHGMTRSRLSIGTQTAILSFASRC